MSGTLTDAELHRVAGWLDVTVAVLADADAGEFIDAARASRSLHQPWIDPPDTAERAFQSAYLGYAAFAGHAGRGLMTAGLQGVLRVAFGQLGLHRVEANIQPGNDRSIALVRRLGFEKEGYSPRYSMVNGDWRDHERWALREEIFAA